MLNNLVTVLITTTKKKISYLRRLLESIGKQDFLPDKVIIICDQEFDLESRNFDELLLPMVWIEHKQECSLTRTQNHAIGIVETNFLLLLNDDVILETSFIKELVCLMDKDDSLGIVCGKILRMDKRTLDSAGQFLARSRKPLERGYGKWDKGQFDRPEFIFGACGAAVLYRKKMLEDIALGPDEYFDNDYHMFYEDLDVSWRAHRLGWKAFYNPRAIAYHCRGASAKTEMPKYKSFSAYNFVWLETSLKCDLIKNRYMTILKNDQLKDFLLNLPWVILYEIKMWGYCLFFEPKVFVYMLRNMKFLVKAMKKRKLFLVKMKRSCR